MEKLQMCRICLVENVRMYLVASRTIFELYERLTKISFVTDDKRPNHVCYFCFAKLKASYQLMTQCLVADELFTRLLIRDYERNPSISHDQLVICGGLVKSATEILCNVVETVSIVKKDEIPAVSEILNDDNELEEEHRSDGATIAQKLNQDKPEDATTAGHTDKDKSDSEVIRTPLKRPTIAQNLNKDKPEDVTTAGQTDKDKSDSEVTRTTLKRVNVAQALNQDQNQKRRKNPEDANTTRPTDKNKSHSTVTRTTPKAKISDLSKNVRANGHHEQSIQNTKSMNEVAKKRVRAKENPAYNTELTENIPLIVFQSELRKQREAAEKKRRSRFKTRTTVAKKSKQLTRQRTTKQKDAITADQTKKGKTKSIINRPTRKRVSKPDTKFKEKCDQQRFNAVKQNKPSVEKPKKCDICERSFSRPALLTIHKRSHTGEKPFKCDICQRSFSDKGNLTRHNRLHTGEKSYKCQICERRFRNNDTFKKHYRIHVDVKPYTCDVCQRSFRETGNLTKHLRIHTGEKPYKCSICKHKFSEKGNLTKHISKMHQTIERKNVYPIQRRRRQNTQTNLIH